MHDRTGDAFASDDVRWACYATAMRDRPPRPLLVRAAALLPAPGEALDLGCGAGNDTRYLLARGFRVTAVDANDAVVQRLAALADERLTVLRSTFANLEFVLNGYDLVSAQFSLPFNPPETFAAMFARLVGALRPGAIFAGHFFGVRDAWNRPGTALTFQTRAEAEALLQGLELVEFQEQEEVIHLGSGAPHRAHVFEIIARRPEGTGR